MATRVFQLAKELGVTSKMILDKCRAEGLDLKNHMATLSAGLEATIREWFSEGATVNAVEVAETVDLEAARRQAATERRRRHHEEGVVASDEEMEAVEGITAPEAEPAVTVEEATPVESVEAPAETSAVEEAPTSEPQVAAPPVEAPAATPVEAEPLAPAAPETPAEPEAPEAPEVPAVAAEAEPETRSEEPPAEPQVPTTAPRGVPNRPKPPEVVGPAGPQLVPRPAQLQGPRVVRVEKPDHLPPPRRTGGYAGPRSGAGTQDTSTPPPGGRRRVGTAPAVGTESTEDAAKRGGKRRSPRRKGGRSAEGGEGIREWRDRDLDERRERLAAATGGGLRRHRASIRHAGDGSRAGQERGTEVEEPVTIKSLSAATGIKSADLIKRLFAQGVMATVNQTIDADTAEALALEFGIAVKVKRQRTAQEVVQDRLAQREAGEQVTRPAVVTFLGHVDHGKTSLLDRIRSASVVTTESGGITQHIGSYRYEKDDRVVTFLDTPGHEAFTQMRARGANMTDVVVLVVAADDGVMPQTVEAIAHAKAAEVPIVVAMNKIDLPNANEQRLLGQLSEHGLMPREWGGDTEVIRTSAATGQGIDDLVETLALEAELQDLKADPAGPAVGTVIEAEMDSGRGVVARLLVQDGTLHVGDVLLAGPGYGRVRQILDYSGRTVQEAGPSTPVEVSGLDEVPEAGDPFYTAPNLSEAKDAAEEYRTRHREEQLAARRRVTLDNLFEQISAGQMTELPLIVKADVQGSVEVLTDTLNKLSTPEVRVRLLHVAVGGVTTSDILLAEASNAIILGFHVVADHAARVLADRLGVDIRLYRVIYQLTDEVKQAMQGLLEPEVREEVLGHAEVRETFKVTRVGTIAGCYVTDGVVQRNAKLRITRDNIVIEDERQLESLKRFKDDAREVRNGMECGIKIAGYDDIKVGDVLEAYTTVEVARKL